MRIDLVKVEHLLSKIGHWMSKGTQPDSLVKRAPSLTALCKQGTPGRQPRPIAVDLRSQFLPKMVVQYSHSIIELQASGSACGMPMHATKLKNVFLKAVQGLHCNTKQSRWFVHNIDPSGCTSEADSLWQLLLVQETVRLWQETGRRWHVS